MSSDRYISFGERIGAMAALMLPLDDAPQSFRTAVWNFVRPRFTRPDDSPPDAWANAFWMRMAADKRWDMDEHRGSSNDRCALVIKAWLLDAKKSGWHEVYELIESFPRWAKFRDHAVGVWQERVNAFLSSERSPYRFANHQLIPITSEQELAEVAEAASIKGKYAPTASHVSKAIAMFSARPQPDYENACKEAASAVEAALNAANGKQSAVGDAVKLFAHTQTVHPALMETANKLFGYASDRDGVRHARKSAADPVDFAEAKLVIVSASAWVNFIAAKSP